MPAPRITISGVFYSFISLALVIGFVILNSRDATRSSEPTKPAFPPVNPPSTTPLSPIARSTLIKRGDSALKRITASSDPESKLQITKEHLRFLTPYPQFTIDWLEKLNEQSLGEDHQQWNKSFLEYQASRPQPPAGRSLFLPPEIRIPSPDESYDAEKKAQQAQENQEREMRIAEVKFLITLYRDLLGDDQMLFPSVQVLPSLGSTFTRLVEDDQEPTIKEKLAHSLESLDDFRTHQLLAMEEVKSPLMADLIRRNQKEWLLPIALESPALAGRLIGHLIPVSISKYDPLDDAYITTRDIGRQVAKERGLIPLARFLGSFLKQCPAFGIRLEDSHGEVIRDAWKNHFAAILKKQADPSLPNWEEVYQETFFRPAEQLDLDERAVLAFGLRSFFYSHFDTFSYSSKDGKSVPPRITMRNKVAELLSPYPEFQVWVVATATDRRHDFKEESQVTAALLKAFLLNQNQPFYLRFQIAKQAIRVQYRGAAEFENMAPALTSILCEFVDKGYSGQEIYAGHILTEIRKQAKSSANKPLWQKQCARIAECWSTAYRLPNSVFKGTSILTLNELTDCALASGDEALVEKMITDHLLLMQGNFPLISKLILKGKVEQAASLCKNLASINRNYQGLPFNADLERALPLLLTEIQNDANRFIVETHLAGRKNPHKGDLPTTTRINRLRALALRYPEISFPSARTEVACLSILCSEPSVAWHLKDVINRKVGDFTASQFKGSRTEFEKRGFRLYSHMLLYNAHLGNLVRSGEHQTVVDATREFMALSKDGLNHGYWMLGDLLRVLYDHFLVMAKDGRVQEIAAYHELTREIYQLMASNHKGWNYRKQSLAIMVFCHAAAKQFDQLLPWARKTGGEVGKHYQEYHRKLVSNWSPRQNPFTNLAIFWDLRGRFDTPELTPHRRAAALILMEDPTLLKEAIHPDFLTHCAKVNVNNSKVLTFEDVIAILDTWKENHPDHPGWPEEYAAAFAALKNR